MRKSNRSGLGLAAAGLDYKIGHKVVGINNKKIRTKS